MEQGSLTYAQAERAFAELERLRQSGQISRAECTERLSSLRVVDQQGRLWMLQERTGKWFVYDNGAWTAATPTPTHAIDSQPAPGHGPPEPLQGASPSPAPRRKGHVWLAVGSTALLLVAVAVALLWRQHNAQGALLRQAPPACQSAHTAFDLSRLDTLSHLSDDQRTVLALNGPPQAFTLAFDPLSGAVIEEWSYFTLGQQLMFLDGAYQGGIEAPAPQIVAGATIPAPAMYPWEVLEEPRPACVVKMAGPALFLTSALVLPGWNDDSEVARLWMLAEGGTMITVDGRLALVSIDPGVALDLEEYRVGGLFIGALGEGADRVGAILSPGDGMGRYRLSFSPRGQGTTRVGTEVILDLEGLSLAGEYTLGANARASVVDRDGFVVPAPASGTVTIASVGNAFDIMLDARVDSSTYRMSGMVAVGLWRSWDRLPGLALNETWPPVTRRAVGVQPTAAVTRLAEAPPTATPAPEASWRLLLQEPFDSNVNEWFTGTRDGEKVRLTTELAQGRYSLLTETGSGAPSWAGQSIEVAVGSRFSISLEATQTGDATSYCGLYVAGEKHAGRIVLFASSVSGSSAVLHGDGEPEWERSPSVQVGGANRLAVFSDGSEIVFLVNGAPVGQVAADGLDVRWVGVVASYGSSTATECSFDDLEIWVD
jgi:hypothetical protein